MRLTRRSLFWLKVVFHLIGVLPIVYLVLKVMSDNAGGDPVQYIIHYTGIGALNALVATLAISPLAKWSKQGMLLQTRRLVGLYVFAYASLHVLAFFSLDLLFAWSLFFEEVVKRPYILVGATAYLLLTALAFTSFNSIRRKMGRSWQKLHNAVYLIAVLGVVHFYWSVKSELIEPSIYILLFALLLALRLKLTKKRKYKASKTSQI
ncbi:protein-methionine-sulfoxide reductase heme-binding subunit MsrQ [Shewanella fidelis]|uniref:Protein-methionine-sulfoxide reductase heme-binding subunit MsrQ n=1 Tax=Shewanella fidelis TaxID=173509 RepID=A0AAW8NNY5_9GAMM|nr:protein-methionine-sulfoxide reductase heme-binding subunit MsrQ [Shewanella fidelis]MDR8524075.1 protein-methionine-sulfoxide reductase heme-binding subunit MsrQ [Shewanella fidelis]MDW4810622.1 protein-methionine-sulfoxide reductase heme-binding subunit MsrQ [Shewanella fidelis]MDW4814743.1 protein-methionine-sulfoxide reductase heme-binding subunit MsrQ [Shewanella fidelis]MDW4818833.1 protein-methionine-sulfoxide reductase heme-binding subunit MsrQ [Shewanella fidelis]MDW4823490.1 prote